jgi:hypothetical protein
MDGYSARPDLKSGCLEGKEDKNFTKFALTEKASGLN